MRKLNKRQKMLLTRLHRFNNTTSVDDIDYDTWVKIENMNDHETLYQNANRFLLDLHFSNMYGS